MDSLLSLLVEHTNTHENCCLKKILGLALEQVLMNNQPSLTTKEGSNRQ